MDRAIVQLVWKFGVVFRVANDTEVLILVA